MRFASVTFGVATLLWGFSQAPFNHIHLEELDHHGTTGLEHIHLKHHPGGLDHHAGGLEVEIEPRTADDDEMDVAWTLSIPSGLLFQIGVEPAEYPIVPPPAVSPGIAPEQDLHSHDPPSLRLLPPRAPPV